MKQHTKSARWRGDTILFACISMAVFAVMGQAWFAGADIRHIRTSSVHAMQRAEDVARAALDALRLAEQSRSELCSEADLTALRIAAYSNNYVSDVGRIDQGKILCTALWGVLKTPFALPQPIYRTQQNYQVWRSQTILQTGHTSNMAAFKNSLAIVSPSALQPGSAYRHVSIRIDSLDDKNAANEIYSNAGAPGTFPTVTLEACSRALRLCASAWGPVRILPLSNPYIFVSMLVAGFLSGAAIALVYSRYRPYASIVKRLRKGIERGEMVLVYQEIVGASDAAIKGYEALARWRTAGEHEIGPEVFMPLVIQNKLSTNLAEAVLKRVLADMSTRLAANPALIMAINTEVDDIANADFVAFALQATAAAPMLRRQIHFEVTERADIRSAGFIENMKTLRAAGFSFWIDDFGTGSANLSHLSHTQFDGIKIDRLFTAAMDTQSALRNIVPNLLRLARELDLAVVVEGVETAEQLRIIQQVAPDVYAQGWLFSRPLELDQLQHA